MQAILRTAVRRTSDQVIMDTNLAESTIGE